LLWRLLTKQRTSENLIIINSVNHVEGHLLSSLALQRLKFKSQITNYKLTQNSPLTFPALAMIASGGTTQLILAEQIGKYDVIAQTIDDALGEALDKAARMMGLGYPGGAILEEFAKSGNADTYPLPVPLIGQEAKMIFSYSGLKTAMFKVVESQKPLTKEKIANLSAAFQKAAFIHVERVLKKVLEK
jgi:N6-L-threonylcarbamoyladenine synthase